DHNNILKNNESENGESGILLSSSNNNTIVNNTINSNRMIYWFFEIGFGIAISDSSSNLISGNEMLNNSIAALYLDNSSENIVSSNRMMENPYGVAIGSEAEDNLLLSNQITNCSYCTIYDFTAPSHINYLAYNNSYGSIKWADKTFLGNLTIMKGSLTFPGSVVIGNGFAYFDPSNFTGGIDSSANVTLDLQYKHIFKPLILRDGELCSECIPLGFEDEVIEFTVPSWSNYSVVNNGTRCDLNGDGIVDMPELMTYTARWKTDDGVTRQEVEEARDIWFRGGGYGG
ncbi:MAG: right-handed parallel beta-helix repeat-containing protein, partial [Candidatus Altiarchaeota archaeon]|nr:right-handed parallel beta-helix repeat-containing protein [Candidatus Altiarchaeota archaeon]